MTSFPKPRARVLDRIAAKREREAKALAFRLAVWRRDRSQCQHCGRGVKRTCALAADQGHVHHRHGRNVRPADRYTVAMAVLLCAKCHKNQAVIAKFRT